MRFKGRAIGAGDHLYYPDGTAFLVDSYSPGTGQIYGRRYVDGHPMPIAELILKEKAAWSYDGVSPKLMRLLTLNPDIAQERLQSIARMVRCVRRLLQYKGYELAISHTGYVEFLPYRNPEFKSVRKHG